MNYQIPQISFKDAEGNLVVLKGMNTYPSQVISAKSMRSVMLHGDIEWVVEFQITTEGTTTKVSSRPKDIKKICKSIRGFLKTFHMVGHQTVALNTGLSWKLVHFQSKCTL